MNFETIAAFLSGTIITAIISKIWEFLMKERAAFIKKKEIYFSQKLSSFQKTVANYNSIISGIKGLKNCYQSFGDRILSGESANLQFLNDAVNNLSLNLNTFNEFIAKNPMEVYLFLDINEDEIKKSDSIIQKFYAGAEDLICFYSLLNSERPVDDSEFENNVLEMFSKLKSFIFVCDEIEKYFIHEIYKLRKHFKKYE